MRETWATCDNQNMQVLSIKKTGCGANQDGGGGFVRGNDCASDSSGKGGGTSSGEEKKKPKPGEKKPGQSNTGEPVKSQAEENQGIRQV